MTKIAVYRFEVWDHRLGENVVGPRMATKETIKRIKAAALLESEKLVEESELDGQGYYPIIKRTSLSGD